MPLLLSIFLFLFPLSSFSSLPPYYSSFPFFFTLLFQFLLGFLFHIVLHLFPLFLSCITFFHILFSTFITLKHSQYIRISFYIWRSQVLNEIFFYSYIISSKISMCIMDFIICLHSIIVKLHLCCNDFTSY